MKIIFSENLFKFKKKTIYPNSIGKERHIFFSFKSKNKYD